MVTQPPDCLGMGSGVRIHIPYIAPELVAFFFCDFERDGVIIFMSSSVISNIKYQFECDFRITIMGSSVKGKLVPSPHE